MFHEGPSANLSNYGVFLCIAEQLPRYSQPSYSTVLLISSTFNGHPVLGTQCFPSRMHAPCDQVGRTPGPARPTR